MLRRGGDRGGFSWWREGNCWFPKDIAYNKNARQFGVAHEI